MNITDILTFLTDKRTIIVGAAATISELIIIIINLLRQLKSKPQKLTISEHVNEVDPIKALIWAANPINLIRNLL